ncbi:hypothetical protein G7Y79_00014g037060 [Physcia stellaris]|nr:hypothetical protein G7Y79_00014g037060 [Physcia stellaris]
MLEAPYLDPGNFTLLINDADGDSSEGSTDSRDTRSEQDKMDNDDNDDDDYEGPAGQSSLIHRPDILSLIHEFVMAPSLLDEKIHFASNFSFRDYPGDKSFDLNLISSGRLAEYDDHKLAVFMEEWLIHGLVYAVFWPKSTVPMQLTTEEKQGKSCYSFSQVIYWLASQTKKLLEYLGGLEGNELLCYYTEACQDYNVARRAFRPFALISTPFSPMANSEEKTHSCYQHTIFGDGCASCRAWVNTWATL